MNGTHRGLNRTLLGALGALLMFAGAMAAWAGTNTAFAQDWTIAGARAVSGLRDTLAAASIPGAGTSWWTVAVFAALLVAAVLLVCWIASQGTGRSNQLSRDKDVGGDTTVDTAVAADAIKGALADNPQVLATRVQSWKTPGAAAGTGLKISVQVRKGASPAEVGAAVEHLVAGIDGLLGTRLPVLVRIKSGTRSKFARTERVA